MSGKRQHIIPKFMLQHFRSKTMGGTPFVWLFLKNKSPVECSVSNIGTKKNFYTTSTDRRADELITKAEGRFSKLLRDLVNRPAGPVEITSIPKFIAHLEIRGSNLRAQFLKSGTYLNIKLLEYLEKPQQLDKIINSLFRDNPELIKDKIRQELARTGVPNHIAEYMLPYTFNTLKNHEQLLNGLTDILLPLISRTKDELPKKLNVTVKEEHIKYLKRTLSPKKKNKTYEKFKYSILEFPSDDMILGDSGVVFVTGSERRYKFFTERKDRIEAIILPLSNSRILLGHNKNYKGLDESEIKKAVASCSIEFFIGNNISSENMNLVNEIGKNAYIIKENELDEIVSRTFAKKI